MAKWLWLLGLGLVLVACSAESPADLDAWLLKQKSVAPPALQATPAPSPFEPEPYHQDAAPDPFAMQKLLQVLRRETQQAGSGSALIAKELKRRKEPLEQYPLDTMAFVGTLKQGGQLVALVKVDKQLFQVLPGAYIGANFGKIINVSESELILREIVQDAAGDWVERKASLQLQENR
jgi:type IV pilus assembly protein PilP